jgi:hypothetical protein
MWDLLILAWLGLHWFVPFPLLEIAELESPHEDKPAATRGRAEPFQQLLQAAWTPDSPCCITIGNRRKRDWNCELTTLSACLFRSAMAHLGCPKRISGRLALRS